MPSASFRAAQFAGATRVVVGFVDRGKDRFDAFEISRTGFSECHGAVVRVKSATPTSASGDEIRGEAAGLRLRGIQRARLRGTAVDGAEPRLALWHSQFANREC